MIGQSGYTAPCSACGGCGRDTRRRSRPCPACEGRGQREYCRTCDEPVPCAGLEPGLDTTECLRTGLHDRRTGAEIAVARRVWREHGSGPAA